MTIKSAQPPAGTRELLPGAQYADAFSVTAPNPNLTAGEAARAMWASSPGWMNALMTVRNLAVTPFGLKKAVEAKAGSRPAIGIFPVVSETPDRVVMGFDDKHLDFRVIIGAVPAGSGQCVTATTVVRTHNLLGRVYLAAVLPFHRIIVPSLLRGLVHRGGASAGAIAAR